MLGNALTRNVGLRAPQIVVETLVRHYFTRLKNDSGIRNLREEELLYDEAFNVIKGFLEAASQHTVEEVQAFSNTRTPSPPWVHVVRLLIPMSCCNQAATYLIQALGGEEVARRTVGGVKWWQVRSIDGVDAQWITAQKDWKEAKRKDKLRNRSKTDQQDNPPNEYEADMDEMRCILYAHGGGYYFGSVDQERYSIQRHARKINGRVLAIDYRLAPQYPFPCALQDLLAACWSFLAVTYVFQPVTDLYLIRPPPEAKHRPVNPAHIVVAGDSAGGGLTLALLQVLRDTELPMPAGGFLISPWCDLTHSFPSIHTNTATDILPAHGLSLQKPSMLWPPPSEEITTRVHASLRSRIRQTLGIDEKSDDPVSSIVSEHHLSNPPGLPFNVGATMTHLPNRNDQTITLVTDTGEVLSIDQQVHLYTENSLLLHPLVSGALSYLGGLPPLLIIASEKEVLRDEIVYTAHKAAYPDRFPVKNEARELYPALEGIESRFKGTAVHLQVYDDTAHVLPVLFSFTTPAKYCHRAIASFCKHVTGMQIHPTSPLSPTFPENEGLHLRKSFGDFLTRKKDEPSPRHLSSPPTNNAGTQSDDRSLPHKKLRRRVSESVSLLSKTKPRVHSDRSNETVSSGSTELSQATDTLVRTTSPLPIERLAGDPIIYSETPLFPSTESRMIRERVSTRGILRPLEPEPELPACQLPNEKIGSISELVVRRYITARAKFDTKFASTIKAIEKHRRSHLERAKKDTIRNMAVLQNSIAMDRKAREGTSNETNEKSVRDGLIASSGWSWAWALDSDERPPPSSIASRRDTREARRLARIADLSEEHAISGNNLWAMLVSLLSMAHNDKVKTGTAVASERKGKSTLSRFMSLK